MAGSGGLYEETGNPFDVAHGCSLDRIAVPCSLAMQAANSGAAVVDTLATDASRLARLGAVYVPDYNDASRDHEQGDSIVGVILGRYEFTDMGSPGAVVAPQKPIKAPLTDGDLRWYQGRKRYAQERMAPGTRCREFLAGHFDFTDVERSLERQTPYDGLRSTIGLEQAGLVRPYTGSDKLLRTIANTPVYEFMRGNRAATAIHTETTRYDVYFDPLKMTGNTLIHEALHSATRLNDYDIAKRLTGIDYEFNPDGSYRRDGGVAASVAISNALALNGCGKF